ncbi:Na+/H+ antiporter NhaA [Herbiconiux ginsengi]|uniref:Na(+)/H(+) antiporter NhaA n=1 Tax=Herbiconiux ginsengi TaxID=381665 RepID=A0A1H3LJL1_9MICO|nr:Na+/H+ antiporter NhaA [Herbiconiux ginsengi]SDY64601.1 sodium/proton antiporter, NhaA family [Herbiconiux ginsengi]
MTTTTTTTRPAPPTRRAARPLGVLTRFRRSPEALRGAVILFLATFAALIWANLPGTSYDTFWHLPLGVELGDFAFDLDLQHWVNDALMAVFFAHVTLEVRRELELGELRDWRRASVPIIAAIAGLIVPALIYVGITAGTGAVGGWGVVVSTDTAFVLGMLALVGRGMPPALRIFVVTLAVSDDVGALGVIAFAYTDDFNPLPLLLAAAGLAVIGVMRYLGVWRGPLYLLPSIVVWIGFLLSGVHATLAGVAIALLLPIFSTRADDLRRAQNQMRAFQMTPTALSARSAENSLARAVSINERAYNALTPYVTWFILPVFALSNAGVRITLGSLADAFTSPLTWGIVIGLVAGKTVAISVATWIVTRFRPGALGPSIGMPHIIGVSLLAGMGFTISLFVTELAFDDPVDVSRAQIGVLAATVLAALLGAVAFMILGARERHRFPARGRLLRPLDPTRDPVLGDAVTAIVTVVEYGNYATPYAARAEEMRREMQGRFGHEVAYTFRHLPLDQPLGRAAALANEAATRQGRFWEMRDELIREAPIETERQIRRAAAAAGLNLRRFEIDWASAAGAERVDQDIHDGETMHLIQAPSYFVGGELYRDAIDADSVNDAVAAARDAAAHRDDHATPSL